MIECYDVSAHFTHGEKPDVLRVNNKDFWPVVKCKDCIYSEQGLQPAYHVWCKRRFPDSDMTDNDFCSRGVPKDQEELNKEKAERFWKHKE